MKVGIYSNKTKEKSAALENVVKGVLENRFAEYTFINENSDEKVDLLIVIGGDGTILKILKYVIKFDVPILSLNAGKLGFLAEFSESEAASALENALNGNLPTETVPIMEAECKGEVFYALNETVVQRINSIEETEKTLRLNISIKDCAVENLKGDGVIVSTQKGSTAYSLSAGGAILSPGTDCFEISPICSHSFNNRSIVYPNAYVCSVKVINDCKCCVVVDGLFVKEAYKNDVIYMRKSDKTVTFYKNANVDYYEKLFMKMK